MVRRYGKLAIWLLASAGMYSAMWAGLHSVPWCWNVYRFLCWTLTSAGLLVFALMVLMALIGQDDPRKSRPYPQWLGLLYGAVFMVTLAAFGHYVYAALEAVQCVTEFAVTKDWKEAR